MYIYADEPNTQNNRGAEAMWQPTKKHACFLKKSKLHPGSIEISPEVKPRAGPRIDELAIY